MLGAKNVTIVYRSLIEEMTAQDAEIAGAQAEGCEILELTSPLSIVSDGAGNVSGLLVQPQIIGAPKWGRPAPRASHEETRVVPCD